MDIKQLFDYSDGVLYWKIQLGTRAKPGQIAGTLVGDYIRIAVDGIIYNRSYLVWLWHYGHPVPSEIDHKDTCKTNDRIENLREANRSQNNANKGIQSNNTSGVKGVIWARHANKWAARIHYQRKIIHLGYFFTIEEATKARQTKFEELFGEFARHD